MAKVAIALDALTDDQRGSLQPYHIGLDDDGQPVSKFKYLPGIVRQYRFDGKQGKFMLNLGGDNFKDIGRSLTFRPLAWRFFYDPNLFNMGPKRWAELFFVDDKNVVSAVLFHEYSVTELESLIGPLHFDDLELRDVVLTATADKKTRADGGTYYIAKFTYTGADEVPAELKAFLADTPIYRADSLTEVSEVSIWSGVAFTVRPSHNAPLAIEAAA